MTDSATTNLKLTYEELKTEILQFEKAIICRMKSQIESIKYVIGRFDLLQLNHERSVEKLWEITFRLDNKELIDMDGLLTEMEVFIKRLEKSINSNKSLKRLETFLFAVSKRYEEYNLFYCEKRDCFFANVRKLVCILKNELNLTKSTEKQKIEDKIVDEVFHKVINSGHIDIMEEIVDLSKNINLKRRFKFSNLKRAIDDSCNDYNEIKIIVELLINQQEEYNAIIIENGNTLLHCAVFDKNVDTVALILRELLKEDKDINPKNNEGVTPFHFAIENGDLVITDMFLDALKKKKKTLNLSVHESVTPLHIAANNNNSSVFKRLLLSLLENGEEINPVAKDGVTPLHLLAKKGDLDIFDLLLNNIDRQGGDLNPKLISDKNKRSVLDILAIRGEFELFENLLKKLIKKDEEINPVSINGTTPLHLASRYNHEKIVRLLIKEIKFKKEELSPKVCVLGQEVTPFLCAAANANLNLVELFLKEKSIAMTENINPMTRKGKTVFQLAIALKNTEVVKQMLIVFLNKEKTIYFHTNKKERLPEKEILEAAVLINKIEYVDEVLKSYMSKDRCECVCISILVATSLYKNNEVADRIISFLAKNKDVTFISHVITQSKKELKTSERREFIEKIKKNIFVKQKATKDFHESILSELKEALIGQRPTETIDENKSLMQAVQAEYDWLLFSLEINIKALEGRKDKTSLNKNVKNLMEIFNPLAFNYIKLKNDFLTKEEELKRKSQEKVDGLLKPLKEKIQWSSDLLEKSNQTLAYKMSVKTKSADLKLKIEDLAEKLKDCQSEVDKTQYVLSPTVQDKFKVLSECNRALLGALIVFGGKDRENKEKEIAYKKQEEAKLLEREIEKITVRLSTELEVTSSFIQESTAYFNKVDSASELISDILKEKVKLLKVDLLDFQEKLIHKQEKQKRILLKNGEERKSLKNALEKEINQNTLIQERTELEWKVSLITSEVFNHLQDKRKKLEKEWLTKVEAIQEILSLVLKHNQNHPVISNKKDRRYVLCERYKKHFDCLEKIKISADEFDSKGDLSKEHKRMVDLNADLLKRREWLERKTEEVRSVEQELTLCAFNETKIKVDDSQQSREVYLPSFEQKPVFDSKRKSKKTSIPLLGCYLELERANQIVELLNSDKNTNRDLIIKKNALFLAIAMVCESLKQSENMKLLQISAREVRNAIYHDLIEDKLDEEKYQQLMSFTKELCYKGIVYKLENFFNIFPRAQPEDRDYLTIINRHIQYLEKYFEDIENGQLNIEENIVLQSDIAFRLAQIFALQTDLSKVREYENQANKEIRAQLQEMFKNLNMKKSMFRNLANAVRHEGIKALDKAIDEWLTAVGGALSERSFRQDKKSFKGLNRKMAKLSL